MCTVKNKVQEQEGGLYKQGEHHYFLRPAEYCEALLLACLGASLTRADGGGHRTPPVLDDLFVEGRSSIIMTQITSPRLCCD